jgi:hypothetical protein
MRNKQRGLEAGARSEAGRLDNCNDDDRKAVTEQSTTQPPDQATVHKPSAVPLWATTKCRMTQAIFAALKGDSGRVVKAMLDCIHH